ncbi:MAG: hypothetical protein CSA70_00340 [Rhodobacterales bacterium]|nr:MAG: hypothetical protein CSA70_00340 [Rhodobacterales bacterium]
MTEAVFALLYLLNGASLWRMIVVPMHIDDHETAQRELQQWRHDALAEEAAGNLAILIAA